MISPVLAAFYSPGEIKLEHCFVTAIVPRINNCCEGKGYYVHPWYGLLNKDGRIYYDNVDIIRNLRKLSMLVCLWDVLKLR